MRMVNDLIVRGKDSEVDKLVGRIKEDAGNGWWKREPTVEENLRHTGIGRLGVYCYSCREREGRPAVSLLIYRTGPGELSASSIISTGRVALADEQYNVILSDFENEVLRPLVGDLDITTTFLPPRQDRLEQSLSPDAFRKLNWFALTAVDRAELSMEDRANWDAFWHQVYSDGSLVDDRELGTWLVNRGFPEHRVDRLMARKSVGQFLLHSDMT